VEGPQCHDANGRRAVRVGDHLCVCAYVYVRERGSMCAFVCVCARGGVCACVCVCVRACVRHAYLCVHMCLYVCGCIHQFVCARVCAVGRQQLFAAHTFFDDFLAASALISGTQSANPSFMRNADELSITTQPSSPSAIFSQ